MRIISASKGEVEKVVLTEDDDIPAADFFPEGFRIDNEVEAEVLAYHTLPLERELTVTD